MDKPGLRDALPQPRQSDTRNDPFWSSLDSSLSAAAAATPQPAEHVAKRDLDVGLGDVARGVGAGALDLVGGIGELARQASNFGKENAGKQGGDYLEQARANMANKLSPVLDVVAGAGDLAASGAVSLNDGMSADAKEALGRRLVDETPEGRLTLGDGAGDIDVWAMKMAQGVGSLLPTLAAGGVTGVAAKASIGRAVTASMIKRGATQEVAEAVAAKAVSKIATGAAVTTGTTGSVGSAGVNTRDTVLGMSFDELSRSDTFRQAFTRIDQDQQTQHLSDEEKLSLAREETANVASRATMSDAKVWGAAAMGSMMGDAMLFKMLAGKAATGGVLKGAAKGAAGEGISETLEEGVQQYAVNESLNEVAAADIDPMKWVMSSAIEGGLIGMGTGGAVGAVGGARGGKHASQEDGVGTDPVAEPSAPVTEGAAGPAVDPNFASVPLEDGEQAPSASQAKGELNPLGPSASQFPGVFERDQRGILRVKGDVDVLASWAEQADMPYITDGDGIAIPAKYAKQAEKAIKGYRPVAAEPMAEPAPLADVAPAAPPADMPRFSQVDPIADEPAIKRQGFVMRNGDGQSTGEPEPYVRPQSGDELLYESSANWQAGQPHAESAPVDLEALRKESAQRWRDGNKPEAGTPVRTEEDTEQALNALRAEGVNGWAGRQDPKLDMPKGQEFIPHGPQAGLPAVVGDGVQQAAGKAKGLPLSDTIFAGGPSHGGQADNTNYARPHLSRDQVDSTLGEESIRDPRSPVAQSIEQAGSATDSVFGPLKSLRITRKGKPFGTEKEAAMASRKGQEMPVPLNGGGFGVAAIGEVQQAQAQQGGVKQPSSNSAQQDRQDGKTEIAQNGMVIVHGSGNPGMSEQDIQIVRASGQKQGKKGRVYGGFYGTSEQDAHQAQAYADMMGGTPTLYDVKIKPGTKVLHKQGDITRLSESYINELVSQGYGVVTGTDPRGQTEHVVIDKSAVASMAPRGAQATPSQVDDINVADMRQPSDQPAKNVSADTVPAPSATAGEASQLVPAIDTGYRDVIPSSEQSEVTHGQPTPIPAISSERPGDQPGAGDPVATGVGQTPAELAERAGPGDPADGAPLTPLPVTQPGEENSLTAPAPAGVAVSEEAQAEQARTTAGPAAAPTPWSEMIDNPDGTITLKGEVPIIKQWAKDNGVKAIPGKGGLVVSKTSADKVRQLTTHSTSEPVRQIEAARAEVAPEPTEAQKEAGNYKKGHLKLQGLDIALENPKGSTRSGTDQDGRAWQSTMAHDYGYIKRTLGADGDHVDVFIGDKPDSETVYVVDQVDPKTGKFDEHKVMMGFSDEQAAREGYLGNYEAGWKGLGAIKAMPVESFKRWVKEGDTTKPADSMESEPVDANALADEEAIAVADELGIEHGDNPDDARWGLDGIKADVLAAAVGRVRNPGEPVAIKRPLDNPNIVAAPPMEGDPVTRAKKVRMSQQREGGYEGLSVDEATRIVDDFLADFNGNIPLKPFIREKVSEIYRNVADDSDTARTTKGAYHPSADLFTVVAGNARGTVSGSPALRLQKGRLRESVELGAKADLLKTLRHELLGHYGLDTFAPEDKRALLQKLIAAQKEPWLAPAWRHASNLGDQLDAIKEHERELAVAEEAFARLAERELPSRAIQTWNDIKATFSRLLRKIGLVKGPIKEHELDSLIRAVSKGIRNGERTRQNIRGDKEVIGKQADEPAKDDKPERIIRFSKQAMAQGDKPAKHLTRKEAELVSHGWFKQYRGASGIKVQIHATQAELEGALGLDAKDGLIRRAAFDDDAGTLHVAADTISDPKRMREILRHEVLAHYGLANVLGDGEYTKLMSRLIQSQKDPSMKAVWDWVNTHYADEDIGTKAEEVVAHLAELEQGAWGRGWDRVVAWVTRALRAVGFVPDGITAAETRSLIEGLGKKLQRSGPDDSGPDGGKKFSQEAERPTQKGGIKMSQSVADNSPSLEQSITQKAKYQAGAALGSVKNYIKQKRPVMLGTLTDLQIDQVYRDITGGAVSEYQRLRTQMEADRNDILLDAETRIDPLWDALDKQVKTALSNLMHDATMARLHPDKSLDENSYYLEAKQKVERAKKPETKAAYEAELHIIERNHSELARQYNALPANAKALYDTMQDTYTKQWESLRGAIEQRLEDLLGVNQGRAMAAEMRQKMEHALQHGPYFPLTRYGDYVVKARKGDEYVREHFERRAVAEQAVKQYQRDGYNAVMTVKEEGGGDSANANQLGMEMLSFLDSADGVSKSALKDEIWQAMLRMMPDASYAKHAIHRRRVKGASRDAHRAYLNSVYHYARHVSKIRYGHKMQGELDKLSEQIRAGVAGEPSSLKPEDLEIAQQVLNEMNKRHDLNMNPTGKAWAGSAGNIGFLYYIGPSVASAVVNMTQNFTVMLPQLGAKYGFAKSAAAMTQALGDYVKHGKFKAGTTEAWHSLTRSTTLPADERAILDRLYRAGALDLTQAHSIAAKADTDQQDAKPMGKRWRRAMRWAGATFHNAEVLNREVAALAAYRLLKQAEPTLNGQQYADRVAEMVYDGHGNYAASNRPRYMRNDITKVLTQFKIYSQMMTYVLYSNAIKAAKGDKVAQKTLAGVLATHWVMAGVMGLPTPITAVVYAIAAGLDDDDDRSGEASFRLALTEALGPRAGELLAKGPMDALTNLSIAGRTGLGDLWWRSPKEGTEGDDLAWHAVQQLLGPVAGIGINLARGAGQMTDGHIQRGLETMLPKSIRDVAKSYRQATEGEQTIKGDIIMDDVSTWNVAMQGLGFGSAQMAKNYDAREYIKGKEKRIADKRSQLLTDYYMARKSGEMDEVQEVLERIKMFNSINHPRERITGKSLALSFKSKRNSNERTQGGVYLNRNREYLREEGRFAH
ncbi:PLxRFG domain-containing protein [Aeromonas caviae]|uniref:PLxRFG domain-containing protein n=1 Tax=Aeromonas caviae TaxID=648 RepID=UPI0029DA836F|nr:PLxRFG domain-containing protein [Aeromonas caviae]MDX7753339.1 PLxRFG domain-containing protein [Aeromonas caviae]MDX7774089.1 PLxRFG domain-containing protein [Aeromonas caviae]